ncbi:MAG: polysaccharide biosynthesis/export family protein [Lacibacter sp.]
MLKTTNLTFLILLLFQLTGCLTYRDIVNFQDGTTLGSEKNINDTIRNQNSIRLKPEDIVQVVITSYNKDEAAHFNLFSGQVGLVQQGMNATVNDPLGYRIDSNGNIEIPIVGSVHVQGLTMEEMRDEIYTRVKATGYLKDLNVMVRFLSFRVTVMGEVNSPGTYTISSQRITVLEALGLAHDVNLFSKRSNVLVIRELDGKRTYGRVNLKSKDLFVSPWYYLQPNDIVYVEPHRAKILAAPDPASRYISTVIAAVSLVLLILR